jgi:hypothetical protein
MAAHDFKRALAVDFFLQPPQRPIHRFAFFQSYFSQRNSLPFQRNLAFREFKMGAQYGLSPPVVNAQKSSSFSCSRPRPRKTGSITRMTTTPKTKFNVCETLLLPASKLFCRRDQK